MILSTKILNFDARFANLVEYFTENQERFGYTTLQMESLEKLWEEWKETIKKYVHPATFGDFTTFLINNCYDRCYPLVASMKKKAVSLLIELTVMDQVFLETNTNTKSVGKTPVTDYAPNLVCLENKKSVCRFFAMDPEHLGTKRKPVGADKVGIMLAYTEKDATEPTPEDYKKESPEKKSIFEVTIPADKSGMVMYIKVYYISPTGEAGKPSAAVKVNLL